MKTLQYQQRAVNELVDKTIRLHNDGGSRQKIVLEAPTGAGKTVMFRFPQVRHKFLRFFRTFRS